MYTEEMSKAFHSHKVPEGFDVEILDYNDFIGIKVDPNVLAGLSHELQIQSVDYINAVKKSLEDLGAIVWVTRDTLGG